MTIATFDWSASVIWDGPGTISANKVNLSADRLERARYAEFLTNYLVAEGKQRNYVLNLNAEWGAGKTWFIKRWYMQLKQHYPTVYIDAWQQDFSDDPLLTVISSIIDQLKHIADKENPIPEGMRKRLLGLFKIGGKLALKAAIKKVGLGEDDFSLEGEEANQLVDTLCSNQQERYESIQFLKQEIRQWVEGAIGLSEGKLDYPAFILIDELDRCRPSYAVEMLETIKHIFDVPGVVFVLATDTEQLQHAVKSIYGNGFDGKKYFERFFDSQRTLKKGQREQMASSRLDLYGDDIWLSTSVSLFPKLPKEQLAKVIAEISSVFGLSIRDMNRMISNLFAIISNLKKDTDIIFLMILYCLYLRKKDIYQLALMDNESVRSSLPRSSNSNFDWSVWVNDLGVGFLRSIKFKLNLSSLDQRCKNLESSIDAFDYFVWVYSTMLNDNQNAVFLSGQIESETMFHEVSYDLQRAVIKLVNRYSGCSLEEYHDLLTLGVNE